MRDQQVPSSKPPPAILALSKPHLNDGRSSTAWGVATTGALMFGAVSLNSKDPFFPAIYGSETKKLSASKMLDYC